MIVYFRAGGWPNTLDLHHAEGRDLHTYVAELTDLDIDQIEIVRVA